jgi:hypothetical protein
MKTSAKDFCINKFKHVENPKNQRSINNFLLQNYNDLSENEFPDGDE